MEEYSGKIDVTAPARGIVSGHVQFLFGIVIAETFSQPLMSYIKQGLVKNFCAVEAQPYATVTLSTLKEKRNDDYLWIS